MNLMVIQSIASNKTRTDLLRGEARFTLLFTNFSENQASAGNTCAIKSGCDMKHSLLRVP